MWVHCCNALVSKLSLMELLLPDFGFLPPLTCCNSSLLRSPDFTPEFTPAETWTLCDLHCFLFRVITQKSLGQPVGYCTHLFWGGAQNYTTLLGSRDEQITLQEAERAGRRQFERIPKSWVELGGGSHREMTSLSVVITVLNILLITRTVFHTYYLFNFCQKKSREHAQNLLLKILTKGLKYNSFFFFFFAGSEDSTFFFFLINFITKLYLVQQATPQKMTTF